MAIFGVSNYLETCSPQCGLVVSIQSPNLGGQVCRGPLGKIWFHVNLGGPLGKIVLMLF